MSSMKVKTTQPSRPRTPSFGLSSHSLTTHNHEETNDTWQRQPPRIQKRKEKKKRREKVYHHSQETQQTTSLNPPPPKMPSLRLRLRLLSRSTLRAATSPSPRLIIARPYSSSPPNFNSTFQPGPSPPRLPAAEQAEFERLQRAVADRLADPTPLPHERPAAAAAAPSPTNTPRHTTFATSSPTASTPPQQPQPAEAAGAESSEKKEDLPAGGVWRGARPEFDGDTNPKTGEVGGPKTEPLRWGSGGDWSYNGRVTDF